MLWFFLSAIDPAQTWVSRRPLASSPLLLTTRSTWWETSARTSPPKPCKNKRVQISERAFWTEAAVCGLAFHACPLLCAGPSPKPSSSLRSTKRSLRTKRYEEAAEWHENTLNICGLIRFLKYWHHCVHFSLCCNLYWQIYDFASLITGFDLGNPGHVLVYLILLSLLTDQRLSIFSRLPI